MAFEGADEQLALVLTDRVPRSGLADALTLCGYKLHIVHEIGAARDSLAGSVPHRVVVGPLRSTQGLESFLCVLQQLGVDVMVLADNEALLFLAQKLGLSFRWLRASS